jgi:hypothetical protein
MNTDRAALNLALYRGVYLIRSAEAGIRAH